MIGISNAGRSKRLSDNQELFTDAREAGNHEESNVIAPTSLVYEFYAGYANCSGIFHRRRGFETWSAVLRIRGLNHLLEQQGSGNLQSLDAVIRVPQGEDPFHSQHQRCQRHRREGVAANAKLLKGGRQSQPKSMQLKDSA